MGFFTYLAMYRKIEATAPAEAARAVLGTVVTPLSVFANVELVVPVALLLVFLFCLGIIATHRIAGPLFRVKRHLEGLQTGAARGPVILRANDELQDLVESVNSLIEFLEDKDRAIAHQLREVERQLAAGDREAAVGGLREIHLLLGKSL
jgi:signal transduction histidine kinase